MRKCLLLQRATLFVIIGLIITTLSCEKDENKVLLPENWTEVYQGFDSEVKCIHFVNQNIGFVGCDYGIVYKTINGGTDWEKTSFNTFLAVESIVFTDENTGFLTLGREIYKTTDQGDNWEKVTVGEGLIFKDANHAFTFGCPNEQYYTTDGGQTWVEYADPDAEAFDDIESYGEKCIRGMFFVESNSQIGFAYSDHLMFKTTDGGNTWDAYYAAPSEDYYIRSVYFSDENNGFVFMSGYTLTTNSYGEIDPLSMDDDGVYASEIHKFGETTILNSFSEIYKANASLENLTPLIGTDGFTAESGNYLEFRIRATHFLSPGFGYALLVTELYEGNDVLLLYNQTDN